MFSIDLTQKERALFDLLITIPPDLQAAEALLQKETYTVDEVSRVGLEYAENSYWEMDDSDERDDTGKLIALSYREDIIPDLHSTYICDVLALLLQYGLDPNGIYENGNIMHLLQFFDNEFVGADALALLLDHGGDLNLISEGEPLFPSIDFRIWFDSINMYNRRAYASTVHLWMVLVGYGALTTPNEYIQLFREFDSDTLFDMRKLKHHRNYYFGVTRYEGKLFLSIYDKAALWEVMRVTL